MPSRRIIFPLTIVVVALALWWCTPDGQRSTPTVVQEAGRPAVTNPSAAAPNAPTSAEASPRVGVGESLNDFPLAARLNAPNSTISADLDALGRIFDAWRTNFPREGNPVGENHEITASLLGDNPLGLALLPKTHPAINAQRELCDRWGTPFRFHQLSGERMEIRSAGPDRKFGTADDALWSPGS